VKTLLASILGAFIIVAPAAAQVRVIDGDTMDVDGQRVRLWGVDAPEGKQSCTRDGMAWLCGQEAGKALRELVSGQDVTCREVDRDRYKRSVAVCSAGGTEINAWLAREGWALDYRQYSKGAYAEAEKEAREAKRGLWAGTFDKPWDWRRKKR
jgi:endonuclease YncB( thermonuclease family)